MNEIIIISLLVFIVIREILCYKERDKLTKKIMAKDYIQYASFEAVQQKKEVKTEKKIAL